MLKIISRRFLWHDFHRYNNLSPNRHYIYHMPEMNKPYFKSTIFIEKKKFDECEDKQKTKITSKRQNDLSKKTSGKKSSPLFFM